MEQKTVYIAEDGAKFDTLEECEAYEELDEIAKYIKENDNYHEGALNASPYEIAILIKYIIGAIKEK